MILIMKDKRISNEDTEKTLRIVKKKISKKKIGVQVSSFEDLEFFIENGKSEVLVSGKSIEKFKLLFFRKVGKNRALAFMMSKMAKKKGIEFLDKIYENTNEPGKLKQTFVLALGGVSVPKTYYAYAYDDFKISRALKHVGLPAVIKRSKSRKGLGVFLAKSKDEAKKIIAKNKDKEVIFQEFIPNKFDYRVLVLGNEIACIEKRTRTKKNEFRNNVYLGAQEEFLKVSDVSRKIKNIAINAARVSNIQVAGVDVVIGDNNNAYIFEVNRAPAFTHDDKISPELNLLTEYLIKCSKKEKK